MFFLIKLDACNLQLDQKEGQGAVHQFEAGFGPLFYYVSWKFMLVSW